MQAEVDTWRKPLEDALKEDRKIIRLEIISNDEFLRLEESIAVALQSKLKAHALVTASPEFDWWQIQGMWPREIEGWTVLIRRVKVQGQVRPSMQMPPIAAKRS